MRIRTIKPEFWTDKRVASWDLFTRLLFIGMWSAADDHGRGSAEPERLAAELFPYDLSRHSRETLANVSGGLQKLSESGRITLYEVGSEVFYEVANWSTHQRVDHPGKSRIPNVSDGNVISSRYSRDTLAPGTGNREQGTGSVEQGTGTNSDAPASPPVASVPRERNPLFDALAEMEGGAENLTKPTAKKVGVALAHIKKASPEVTPDEIRTRAHNLSLHMPHATATATSLSSHWARCAAPPVNGGGNHSTPPNPRNEFIGTPESRADWERSFAARQADMRARQEAGEIPFS